MSEPTREEMIKRLIIWYETHYDYLCDSEKRLFQAIRKHLLESDLAHWMDRCHELEVELAKKPVTVSREKLNELLHFQNVKGEVGQRYVIKWLTELGLIVEEEE